MKDVVAVLEGRSFGDLLHVELVAHGIKEAGNKKTTDIGLKAMAKALASCPPLTAECAGPVSVEVGNEDGSLSLTVQIGSVTVFVVIRGKSEMIGDNAEVSVIEHLN
jgi:hypothetical protein